MSSLTDLKSTDSIKKHNLHELVNKKSDSVKNLSDEDIEMETTIHVIPPKNHCIKCNLV